MPENKGGGINWEVGIKVYTLLYINRQLIRTCYIAQWHPTPLLLPGKSHGRRSLVGCTPWGHTTDATSLSHFTLMHWRRKWQPTPAFLPGESQGRGSLVGCRLWGRTESGTTEVTQQQQQNFLSEAQFDSHSLFQIP